MFRRESMIAQPLFIRLKTTVNSWSGFTQYILTPNGINCSGLMVGNLLFSAGRTLPNGIARWRYQAISLIDPGQPKEGVLSVIAMFRSLTQTVLQMLQLNHALG